MKKIATIPSFFAVLVLVASVGAGVFLINRQQFFRLGASPDTMPKDIRVTNISDTSLTISWITDSQTTGFVKWGDTGSMRNTQLTQTGGSLTDVHVVQLDGLVAGKTYYFSITSAGNSHDNNGVPWTTTTRTSQIADNPLRVAGTVFTQTGVPATNVLVYVKEESGEEYSTITSESGNWLILMPASNSTRGISIYVQAASRGIASATAIAGNSNPLPPITLGKTHDFTKQGSANTSNLPDAEITLPESETSTASSRFQTGAKSTAKGQSTVTITGLENNEVLFTTKPEFFGKGPTNTQITITVNSTTPMTGTSIVSATGAWKWSPPANLEEGTHTLTVSWRDANGILQKITRTFVVQAANGDPAFEASTSGKTPTPSPVPTLSPTATPIATIAPTLEPASTDEPVATPVEELPEAGLGIPTIFAFLAGVALLGMGAIFSILATRKL